jgi:hypothetical protein
MVEVIRNGGVRGKSWGSMRAAGGEGVEEGVEDLAWVVFGLSAVDALRQAWLNELPLLVFEVCRIGFSCRVHRGIIPHPRIGYLHTTNFRRFTLNLDIAEVFKPLLVDRTILALIQKRQIRPEHFAEETAGIYMTEEGRKIFLKAWEERLQSTFEHRQFKRHVSYRTAIRLDLYKLEKHLMGEKPYEPFKPR